MDPKNVNPGEQDERASICVAYNKMRYVMAFLGFVAVTLVYSFKNLPLMYTLGFSSPFFLWEVLEFAALLQFTIPFSIIAERYSATGVVCVAFITSTCRLVLPLIRFDGVASILYWKFIQGFTEAAYFTGFHVLIARWSPPKERSLMAAIIWSGRPFGELISIGSRPSYLLASPGTIVFIGCIGALWVLVWLLYIEERPEVPGRFVSQNERLYILKSQNKSEESIVSSQPPFPFKAVVSSKPFWAVLLCHVCIESSLTILQYIPYHKTAAQFPGTLGYFRTVDLSWFPKLLQCFFTIFMGFSMMMIVKSDKINLTIARKFATSLTIIPAITPLLLTYIDEPLFLFFLYTTGTMFSGAIYSGYMINHIDLAPRFAGTLLAATMTVVTLVKETLRFIFIYHVLHNEGFITYGPSLVTGLALFSVNGVLCYWIFGSAEEQSWNNDKSREGKIKSNEYEFSEIAYPDRV